MIITNYYLTIYYYSAEYKTVKEDSSHQLHEVYINCVKEFKMQKEVNAAVGKKKPETRKRRVEPEPETEQVAEKTKNKRRMIEPEAEPEARTRKRQVEPEPEKTKNKRQKLVEPDPDVSIVTSSLLEKISKLPTKKRKK